MCSITRNKLKNKALEKKWNDELINMWKTDIIHKIYKTKSYDKDKSLGVQWSRQV